MKLSRFVNVIEDGDSFIIFHSQMGGACRVDSGILNILKNIESFGDTNDSNILEVMNEFKNKGFLVDDDIDYLSHSGNEQLFQRESGKQIKTIQLVVSNNCNFKCKYCFENSIYCSPERDLYQHDAENKIMKTEDAISYVDKIIKFVKDDKRVALHIQFFGGEPLTNKNAIYGVLDEYGDGSKYGIDISYSIVTNGSLIDDECAGYFAKYGVGVVVSFDSPKKSDRDMKSGHNSIEKTNEILDILRKHDAYVAFNSVLGEATYNYFDNSIVDYALEKGVKEIGVVLDLEPSFYDKFDYRSIGEKLISLVRYGNDKGVLISGYWMSSFLSLLEEHEYAKGFKTCSGTGAQLSIEPNGKIFACKGSSAYYGDVNDMRVLVNSDNYVKYFSRSLNNSNDCCDCELCGVCSGFCLGPLEQTFGDINHTVSSYCRLIKYVVMQLLKEERGLDVYEVE